ncbi:flagellar hook-length control protein FliK [Afipia sp. TerB]
MSIAINPVFPVIAAQGVAADVALQPGTVIDARVMKVLENNLVRIAIASLSIEVLSEVPLKVGDMLQLAVSQTPDGIRLQVVPGQGNAAQLPAPVASPATVVTTSMSPPAQASPAALSGAGQANASAAPEEIAKTAAVSAPADTRAARPLTNLEALAVSAAVQSAAARQGSLAPLFANLGVAVSMESLPPEVQKAAAQLLASRPGLDDSFTGDAMKTAFRNSGLFLERTLASPQAASLPSQGEPMPDLKAALIVFRQTLSNWLGAPQTLSVPDADLAAPASFAQQGQARARADSVASPPLAPPAPQIELDEILLPQASLRVDGEAFDLEANARIFSPSHAAHGVQANLDALQDILRAFPKGVRDAVKSLLEAESAASSSHATPARAPLARIDSDEIALSNVPPPPFRGAAPTAQPVAMPTMADDMTTGVVVHRLLDDADAALARQTLLQAASLPDRPDVQAPRSEQNVPRWNFEVPFATPQGTAVAQFEVSRDSTGTETEAARRMWRARFSLDVEPAGPVHALISLSGERTSVRMWAERPLTAAHLRSSASDLSEALRRAELEPGDIVIGAGQPPSPTPPRAGHFMDRAS